MSSDAQLKELYMTEAKDWIRRMDEKGIDVMAMHLIAYNTLESIEASLLQNGVSPQELPTYNRRMGGHTRASAGNFTYCKRCMCSEKDGEGWYCTVFHVGPDKERYYTASDDGCARGIPRKEYR